MRESTSHATALDRVWYVVVVMHNVQRKGKDKKNALPKAGGGEGGVGAAPQGERAGGGTSTTQPTPQNSGYPKMPSQKELDASFAEAVRVVAPKAAPQPQAQNSPKPNGNGDKTLGQHAQQGAQRLYAGDGLSYQNVDLTGKTVVLGPRELVDPRPNWTPNRGRPKAVVAHQTPGAAFATPEGQAAFAEAVVEHEGIKPACAATGLTPAAVFLYAATHPEFRKVLNSALGANFESQVYKLDELCNKLLDMPPREMNQCANAYGRVFDYRMRIVGKLLPVIYGDQPGTQVNIQNNTGIVCNEATRERLIAINQKLLNVQTETKELEE